LSARQTSERETRQSNYRDLKPQVAECYNDAHRTTDWKEARDEFKRVQEIIKNTSLLRDHQQELWDMLNEAFQVLGNRQSEERRQYEAQVEANYGSLSHLADEAMHLARYSEDFPSAKEQISEWRQRVFDTRPLKKDM